MYSIKKKLDDSTVFFYRPNQLTDEDKKQIAGGLALCFGVNSDAAFQAINNSSFVVLLVKDDTNILSMCTINRINQFKLWEIWNVCTPFEKRRGHAKNLLQTVIKVATKSKYKLWLCTDDETVSKMYADLGFSNPKLITHTLSGAALDGVSIQMMYSGNDVKHTKKVLSYLMKFKDSLGAQLKTQKIQLNSADLKDFYSKKLFLNHEIGGQLKWDPKTNTLRFTDQVVGTETTVNYPCYSMVFHTHPFIAYKTNTVGANPISATDLVRELNCFGRLAVVVALEGLYIYQINPTIYGFINFIHDFEPALYDEFKRCYEAVINKLLVQVEKEYVFLWKLLENVMAEEKLDALYVVNHLKYRIQSTPAIQRVVDIYQSIQIKDILAQDSSGRIESYLKNYMSIPYKNLQIYFIEYMPNIIHKLDKPIYINFSLE